MDAILSSDQLAAVNEQFRLDLDYGNASHYRAAQVIYQLWKGSITIPAKEIPNEDTSNEDTTEAAKTN